MSQLFITNKNSFFCVASSKRTVNNNNNKTNFEAVKYKDFINIATYQAMRKIHSKFISGLKNIKNKAVFREIPPTWLKFVVLAESQQLTASHSHLYF